MNVHDYATRQEQRLEREGAKPCDGCGHEVRRHRELRPTTTALGRDPETGEPTLIEIANPDYRAFHFHCEVDGCQCVMDRTG